MPSDCKTVVVGLLHVIDSYQYSGLPGSISISELFFVIRTLERVIESKSFVRPVN